MKCLILAGGFATRLWPFTERRAKPLLPLAGRPMVAHLVERVPKEMEVIISTNSVYADDFLRWAKREEGRKITVFREDAKKEDSKPGALAGTAKAIRELGIKDDLLILAGDNYFGFEMKDFLEGWGEKPRLAAHDIKERQKARKFGVVVEEGGRLKEFQEKPEQPKSSLVSTVCYAVPRRLLGEVVEYARVQADNIGKLFERFLELGEEVEVWKSGEAWFDIGSIKDYVAAHKYTLDRKKMVDGGAEVSESEMRGAVVIGRGAVVKNSTIVDSVVISGARIENCVVKNSIVDKDAKIKGVDLDYKIIREGTEIESERFGTGVGGFWGRLKGWMRT